MFVVSEITQEYCLVRSRASGKTLVYDQISSKMGTLIRWSPETMVLQSLR